MIARFRALLPDPIHIVDGEILLPYEMDYQGHKIRVFPPMQAAISIIELKGMGNSLENIFDKIVPVNAVSSDVLHNNQATFESNLFQLELRATDFERRAGYEKESTAQLCVIFFGALNEALLRIRAVTRSHFLKPISPPHTNWTIGYLNDDGSELSAQPGMRRGIFKRSAELRASFINSVTWKQVEQLPEEIASRTWDILILDAKAALPDPGPAIVLAFTALETFAGYLLDVLVTQSQHKIPSELWDWLTNRSDFYQNPSTEDQFCILLKIVCGVSLKDEPELWEAFLHLRTARNKFAHEGKPLIGGKLVDAAQASELVEKADKIISWGEKLLPEALQRVKLPPARFAFTISIKK